MRRVNKMTREEAIESLKLDGITFGGNSRRLAQFFEALDMAVESLGDKWIPCDERLPDENGRYLATGTKDTVFIAEYVTVTDNGKLVNRWWRVCSGTKANPTAWMPLPEGYKGE